MKKLRLDVGTLAVESFDAQHRSPETVGTVAANQVSGGDPICLRSTNRWTECTGFCCVATWMYPNPCTGYGQTCP
jgi:hypothetical protein